ncbi:DUF1156 domain-containing protein, partial [Candidatus Poribacteria bacterium]|nr:DUF1156 domain-containing protein [Candidatus Poribacteria bacterium]
MVKQKDKRYIEETFPIKEVSENSVRERNKKRGHIKMLHNWWARRPLVTSRATVYAALTSAPTDESTEEWNKKRDFIINLSNWDNSLDHSLIQRAREDILEANQNKPPKVLDPFGGGGAIPLEALRLGCTTYSSDLNPVAVLIQKCTLEYPQIYARHTGETDADVFKLRLREDVEKMGRWVLEEARKDLEIFYPLEADGSLPTGYIWARTIPCQNPTCGVEIPLMRSFWLVNKPKTKARTKVALYPYVENGRVEFKIVGDGYAPMPEDFSSRKYTIKAAVAECLACRGTVPAEKTRQLFQEGQAGERLIAVVTHKPGVKGKRYRVATDDDRIHFALAEKALAAKREKLILQWGMDPVPDEPLPPKNSHRAVGSQLPLYNFENWGDLFNARQNLAMITLIEKVRLAYHKMVTDDGTYAKAVVSYLALILSRHSGYNAKLCWWEAEGERCFNVFGRQTLAMVYDYSEQNPYGILTGHWLSQVENACEVITNLSSTLFQQSVHVSESSATNLEYRSEFFDAVFTDPPYYDNVPYSYLSDFFYVWLKRALGEVYLELFSTPLTPKRNEVVKYSNVPAEFTDGDDYFETLLKKSFQEICRVLKPNGIAIVVYAHTSTEGWETLINSLLDSGLVMTGAWSLHTEQTSRLSANDTAALASSIYIVARKMDREETGFYNDVKAEMVMQLNEKLDPLWEEGLCGADFGIAAIGVALPIFGRYEEVMVRESGEIIRAKRFLKDVRELACNYAVEQINHNGFANELNPLTRFYLFWRRDYGTARIPFDDALKLAQFCGLDLDQELVRKKNFIVKEKKFVRVLGPQDRDMIELNGASEMIDVLHCVLLLWAKGQRDEMHRVLAESKFAESEAFARVAQTISVTLQ